MIDRINRIILKVEDFILSYGIVAMAVLLITNVFFRSVLNNSLIFAEEVGQFLMVIVTFVGISTAARFSRHINMNAVIDNVPEKIRKIMMTVIALLTSITMFYLAYLSYGYTMDVYKVGRISTALEMPMWILIAIVTFGILMTAVQFLVIFIKNVSTSSLYLGSHVKAGEALDLVYEEEFKEFNPLAEFEAEEDKKC